MLQSFITPYSPNLSSPEYFLFPKLKKKLNGLQSADVADIEEAVTYELKKVLNEEFSAAFQKFYNRAQRPVYKPKELILN